jgi:bifunctional non-homologous end joining protein LigD
MLGMHVVVPLRAGHAFASTKAYARALASDLASRDPARVTDRMARSERRGRISIDWLQNDLSRSTVVAYSPRAAPRPTVSTPATWAEIESAVRAGERRSLVFRWDDVLVRVQSLGDLFASSSTEGSTLP